VDMVFAGGDDGGPGPGDSLPPAGRDQRVEIPAIVAPVGGVITGVSGSMPQLTQMLNAITGLKKMLHTLLSIVNESGR